MSTANQKILEMMDQHKELKAENGSLLYFASSSLIAIVESKPESLKGRKIHKVSDVVVFQGEFADLKKTKRCIDISELNGNSVFLRSNINLYLTTISSSEVKGAANKKTESELAFVFGFLNKKYIQSYIMASKVVLKTIKDTMDAGPLIKPETTLP